ncbi:MAG: GNAT family N-acetyltransferase [Flavobacteriales bacterium]|nr:GNAT family N-acetyltransferase [Flavobacteriales bacterium]
MKNYNIRRAVSSDAKAILEKIKELAIQHHALPMIVYTEQDLQKIGLGAKNSQFEAFVAEDQDKNVIGVVVFFFRFSTWKGPSIHIEDLIVSPQCRGWGVGADLMDAVVDFAKEKGSDRIELDVESSNEKAIAFYKKKGFEVDQWYSAKLYLNEKL